MKKRKGRIGLVVFILLVICCVGFLEIRFNFFKDMFSKTLTEEEKKADEKKEKEKKEAKKEEKSEEEKKKEKAQPEGEEQEAIVVKAEKIKKGDFKDELYILGNIEGLREIDLKFQVNGIIEFFNFKEGDPVKKGEVISRLNNKDPLLKVKYRKAKLGVAKSSYNQAAKKLEMHDDLFKIGAIIKPKLEEVQLEAQTKQREVEAATIEVESAKQELSKTYMKAPIVGIIGEKDAEIGEFVTSNSDVISAIDITSVYVAIGIVEKDINKVENGQPAIVTVDTYPDKEFSGEIVSTQPIIQGKSRTLTVKAKVDNSQGLLIPGMFARGRITVFTKKDTISVPIAAIEGKGEESHVFVVKEDNTVEPRKVKVGYIATETVQIDEGLQEGDVVVTDTPVKLKKGALVKVAEEDAPSGEAPEGVGAESEEKE
ncbi:MAG: efflux RND transporter periplasmic adaptor subunit [Candidatus Theseobacter exili]|nr:efflux RND transporter periplasmic adaptor subunit [Candidatus Theseobacter exili]